MTANTVSATQSWTPLTRTFGRVGSAATDARAISSGRCAEEKHERCQHTAGFHGHAATVQSALRCCGSLVVESPPLAATQHVHPVRSTQEPFDLRHAVYRQDSFSDRGIAEVRHPLQCGSNTDSLNPQSLLRTPVYNACHQLKFRELDQLHENKIEAGSYL